MKHKEKSRFQFPCISREQMLGFDINKPETWTVSPLVNAVLDAIETVRPARGVEVARYLGVDSREMSAALHVMTGMDFSSLIELWRKERFKRILAQEPGIPPKDMVQRMAFSSQGALWTFLTRHNMIEPMVQHWDCGKHKRLRREIAQELADDSWKEKYKAELNRRKWEERTKKNNND